MAAVPVATFKESSRGPWGLERPSFTSLGELRGATVRVKLLLDPTEVIGSISSVNTFISEVGLPETNTPTLILDLYAPLNSSSEDDLEDVVIPPAVDWKRESTRKNKDKAEHQKTKASTSTGVCQEDKCADTQLIELAAYPGYHPEMPTPLPHDLDTLEQMRRVTRAHPKLTAKFANYQEAWHRLFYSLPSQAIFLDYYWWFFLHHYQAELYPSVQDSLFSRISDNYVRFLCEPVEIRWRDSFFKMYPDAIAQCVYSTFVCAYPNSWNNFDGAFRNELCLYFTLWQRGTRPIPGLWRKWNLSLLEPQNMLKHRSQDVDSDQEAAASRSSKGLLTSDILSEKHRRRDPRRKLSEKHRRKSKVIQQGRVSPEVVAQSQPLSVPSLKKNMSFVEDKMALAGSKETLVSPEPHNEKSEGQATIVVASSDSVEKRIEMARKQFESLESRSLGLPQPPYLESEQSSHSRAVRSYVNFDLRPKSESPMREPLNWQAVKEGGFVPQAQPAISSDIQNIPHSDICVKSRPAVAGGSMALEREMDKRSASGYKQPFKSSISKSTCREVRPGTSSSSASTIVDTYQQKCGELKRMALALTERLKGDEPAPSMKRAEFEHVLFNLHGHSPLVKHHMNRTRPSRIHEKESAVGRTEVTEEAPEEACYRSILAESKRTSEQNHAMFRKYYELQKHVMAAAHRRRLAEHHKHEENVKLVLSNKREVQQLSSELSLKTFYQIPAHLEPSGICRGDGQCPDGASVFPWKYGHVLVWDVTCPDTFAPSYASFIAGDLVRLAERAEFLKKENIEYLGHFVPVDFETSGVFVPEAHSFSVQEETGEHLHTISCCRGCLCHAVW